MRITSWINNLKNRSRTRRRAVPRPPRRVAPAAVEQLEDRTLLSITSLFFNGDLTIFSDADDTIVVREDPLQAGRVEILTGQPVGGVVTLTPDTAIGSLDANTVQTIFVRGGDGANDIDLGDRLGLGGVDTAVFTSLASVTIDGANGDDTLTGTLDFTDVIVGGHGDDVITVGTGSATIDGGDGDDTITGGTAADVIDGGDGHDVIDGGAGSDTIDAGDGHDVVTGGDELTAAGDVIIGGHGDDTLSGGDGNDWLNGKSGNDVMSGDAGDDTLHGGAGKELMHGGDGNDTVNGHGNSDTIFGNGGSDRLNGNWGHDFIDGDDTLPTTQGGHDTIFGGSGRDTLLGNVGDDLVRGQGGRDTLIGSQGLDKLDGGSSHDVLRGFHEQVVYLDFESATDPQTEREYTGSEQAAIQTKLEAAYGAFDIRFTRTQPVTSQLFLQSGAFVTVTFNEAPSGTGIGLGGAAEASEFDFRNTNLGGTASIDVLGENGLLGGAGQPTTTSQNIVAASTYAAAHSLGHLLGLRDIDAFGPISATVGITDPPGVNAFSPVFPGPTNASETLNHLMAAPSLLGAAQFDVTADLFFSERSAIKLAFNEAGLLVPEQAATHGGLSPAGAQPVTLRSLGVPNTLDSGANAGTTLNVEAAAVVDAGLDVAGENDVYSFEGVGGQLVSIEIFSDWLDRLSDPIDTIVRVYDSSGTVLPYFSSDTSATDVAVNDDVDDGSGQPVTDPLLLNLVLPTTGNATDTYFIQISEPDAQGLFALPTDGSDEIVELDPVTGVELRRIPLPAGETSAGSAALAYDGANHILYFMNGASDVLFEIDASDGAVLDSDPIVSPINTSPGDYDGLALLNGELYILDVTAETIPGQVEDQNNNIPQILDPPEILVFDPVGDTIVRTLNLLGIGEGPEPVGANPVGTFANITGGLAAIEPTGSSALLLLDQRGVTVHEINPTSGVSSTTTSPASGRAGTYDGVGAYSGDVYLATGTGGGNRVDRFLRGSDTVQTSLALTPNAPPSYNLTALGNNDDNLAPTEIGSYELFITKVDLAPTAIVSVAGDTLIGSSGNDSLYGSSGNDLEKGGSGDDKLFGLGGDDLLNGSSGVDVLRAGAGNDLLLGGSGTDRLFGGGDDDTLDGQGGDDTLDGEAGNDTLNWRAGGGSDIMKNSADSAIVVAVGRDSGDLLTVSKSGGNRPDLTIFDGVNTVTVKRTIYEVDIDAGAGVDTLTVGNLEDVPGLLLVVNGGADDDVLTASGARIGDVRLRLDGGEGDDVLTGSLDDDTLWGSDGADRIDAGRGNDTILGGAGDDDLDGQDGDDVLLGNEGNDLLDGSDGHDSLMGHEGFDTINGGLGQDTLHGGDGDDALTGNQADDSLFGDAGMDSLFGGTGDDFLDGGLNEDSIYGNFGDDTIAGGHGHDLIDGAQGDDIINGGDGDDSISGGDGFDGIAGHDGHDTINGGGQDDTILGGDGDDKINAGGGRDIALGGDGNDTIDGQGAEDTLAGNEGVDVLNGSTSEINENFSFYASWVDGV